MPELKLCAIVAVVAAIVYTYPAAAGPQQYKLVPFVFPADQQGYPELTAINDLGQAVGDLANSVHGAGYWSDPGHPTELKGFGHGTLEAKGINNNGVACGSAFTSTNSGSAAGIYWENGTTNLLRPLTTLDPDNFAHCLAINVNGLAVGGSELPGGISHATEWAGNNLYDLGGLGGVSNSSYAFAVNSAGLVVGFSNLSSVEYHATAWVDRVPMSLGSLGGPEGEARAVNDAGQIVGIDSVLTQFQPMGFAQHPFLWQNGVMTDLGTLNNSDSEQSGIALGVSATGVVVGQVLLHQDGLPSSKRAVMWKDGAIIDLTEELRPYLPANAVATIAPAIAANGRFLVNTHVSNADQTWYEVLPLIDTQVVLSATPNPDFLGQTVMLHAVVSGADHPVPGVVTFKDGLRVLGSASVSRLGVAIFGTSSLSRGNHPLTATYMGNDVYAPSKSRVVNEFVQFKVRPFPP